MKRKSILLLGLVGVNCFFSLFHGNAAVSSMLLRNDMRYSYAQNQDVQYSYDSLGRVSTARYPDGTIMKYTYDANGNLLACEKTKELLPPAGGESSGTGDTGNTPPDYSQTGGGQQSSESQSSSQSPAQNQPVASNPLRYTPTDIKNYNQFKKKKPVIKSLKSSKSKKKYYLKVQIKQIKKKGLYGENGYQIKYATNSKFKKAKTIKLSRNKKSSITSKKWNVKKGKTYYVKVRAYMKTRNGKVIYSKYSKTKKLKVK